MKHTNKNWRLPTGNGARVAVAAVGIALAVTITGFALAQNGPPPGGGGKSGPPPEAMAACEAQAEGDICAMALPPNNVNVEGHCITTPDDRLACMPDGAPPPKN